MASKKYNKLVNAKKQRSRLSDVEHRLVVTSGEEQCESESEIAQSDSLRPHGHQAPLPAGFSKQGYWSGLPLGGKVGGTNYWM